METLYILISTVLLSTHRHSRSLKSCAALLPLLVAVVTTGAEWLPVATIPEQFHIATVRDDVINGGGRCAAAGPCTAIIDLKEQVTGFAPCAAIAAL